MSRRGQGGRRAKGRRDSQEPELDSTAWLAELEREAARAGDDEDEEEWASTLRGRRSPDPPPPAPPVPPAAEPGWAPPPADHGRYGAEPGSAWSTDPAPQDPPPAPDPDWSSWRPPTADPFEASPGPVSADPAPEAPGYDWAGSPGDAGDQGWQSADVDTPTGAWSPGEPVGREPDYPALFGELYRRRGAAQQDPIWEAPPDAEPLPDPGLPDPPSGGWPFEETTGTWEPTDRSFIWPAEELPSTQGEWDQPAPQSWLDDPDPRPPTQPPAEAPPRPDPVAPPAPDQTAAWPAPSPGAWSDPEPAARPSPWAAPPGVGNGVPPAPPPGPVGPPPADWAAAIPTDVPAAGRATRPGTASRAWRPDEAVEAEPGVPLGAGTAAGEVPAAQASGARPPLMPVEEPEEVWRKAPSEGRRKRPPGDRQARAWPRIVAVISWIVLVMVVCWFYVFPWLERVLPENF
jgi:hypothetical protein